MNDPQDDGEAMVPEVLHAAFLADNHVSAHVTVTITSLFPFLFPFVSFLLRLVPFPFCGILCSSFIICSLVSSFLSHHFVLSYISFLYFFYLLLLSFSSASFLSLSRVLGSECFCFVHDFCTSGTSVLYARFCFCLDYLSRESICARQLINQPPNQSIDRSTFAILPWSLPLLSLLWPVTPHEKQQETRTLHRPLGIRTTRHLYIKVEHCSPSSVPASLCLRALAFALDVGNGGSAPL